MSGMSNISTIYLGEKIKNKLICIKYQVESKKLLFIQISK